MEKVYQFFPDTKQYKKIEPTDIVLQGTDFYWDTETTGLSWLRDKIFCHSFGDGVNFYIIDIREGTGPVVDKIYEVLRDPAITKYIYNAKFDMQMVLNEAVNVLNVRDVFMYAKLYPKHFFGHKLKEDIVPAILGIGTEEKDAIDDFFKGTPAAMKNSPTAKYIYTIQPGLFSSSDDKVIDKQKTKVKREKKEVKDKDYSKLPEELLVPYAGADIDLMFRVFKKMTTDFDYKENAFLLELEHKVLSAIIKLERVGLPVDTALLKSVQPVIDAKAEEFLNKFFDEVGDKVDRKVFDVYSGDDLQRLYYDVLGESIRRYTEAGEKKRKERGYLTPEETRKYASTDKYALKQFKHPSAKALTEFNMYDDIANKFIPQLLDNSVDGIVYASFNQLGAVSGRLSCSSPNLENIPSRGEGEILRKAIICRPGFKLLKIDASQIEYRIFAHYVSDQQMIDAFKRGEDFHERTAKLMNVSRKTAKNINFGLIYGMGVQALADTLGISKDDAQRLFDFYFDQIPMIKSLRYRILDIVKTRGYIKTLLGRRRYLTVNKAYTGMNAIVQGTAADIFKLMIVAIDDYLTSNNLKTRMINLVHDEILFELADGEERIIPDLMNIMKNVVTTEKGKDKPWLSVPLDVKASIGKNWLEMEDVEVNPVKEKG